MLDLHEPAGQAGLQLACLLLMPSAPHSARYVQYVCMYIHTYTRALSGTLEIHLCAQGSTVPGHHSTFTSLRDRWAPRTAAAGPGPHRPLGTVRVPAAHKPKRVGKLEGGPASARGILHCFDGHQFLTSWVHGGWVDSNHINGCGSFSSLVLLFFPD